MEKWIYNRLLEQYGKESKEELAQEIMALNRVVSSDKDFASQYQTSTAIHHMDELLNAVKELKEEMQDDKKASKVFELAEEAKHGLEYIKEGLSKMNDTERARKSLEELKEEVNFTASKEDKMDIVASICNNFDHNWQLYPDGRLVIEDKSIAVSEKPEWKGINKEGHEEYENADEMLISWLPFLKENDFLGYFEEEISFIERMQQEREENDLEL